MVENITNERSQREENDSRAFIREVKSSIIGYSGYSFKKTDRNLH